MKRKFLLLALALIFVSSASAELAYDSIKLMEYKEWVNDTTAEYEVDEEGFIVDDVEGTTRSGVPFVLDEATERMSKESEASLLRDILIQEFQLPPALVDTLELPRPTPTSAIRQSDIEEAKKWLEKREND